MSLVLGCPHGDTLSGTRKPSCYSYKARSSGQDGFSRFCNGSTGVHACAVMKRRKHPMDGLGLRGVCFSLSSIFCFD